jgi:hypothetical protein
MRALAKAQIFDPTFFMVCAPASASSHVTKKTLQIFLRLTSCVIFE